MAETLRASTPGWMSSGDSSPARSSAREEGRLEPHLRGARGLDRPRRGALAGAGGRGCARRGGRGARVLPDAQGGKPLVATLGLSVEEAERHAIAGPPDGRPARSISMSYTYPQLEVEAHDNGSPVIHAGLAVPLPGAHAHARLLDRLHALAVARVRRRRRPRARGRSRFMPRRRSRTRAYSARHGSSPTSTPHGPAQPPLLPRDARARVRARAPLRAEARADRLRPRQLQGGSTTASGTSPATPPWPRRPSACATSCARPTSRAASAATSSR